MELQASLHQHYIIIIIIIIIIIESLSHSFKSHAGKNHIIRLEAGALNRMPTIIHGCFSSFLKIFYFIYFFIPHPTCLNPSHLINAVKNFA